MTPTTRILMTRTEKGCPDSSTVRTYHEGREYDVPTDLAEAFVSMGAADPAEAHKVADLGPMPDGWQSLGTQNAQPDAEEAPQPTQPAPKRPRKARG